MEAVWGRLSCTEALGAVEVGEEERVGEGETEEAEEAVPL